jgi:hypothetical protein
MAFNENSRVKIPSLPSETAAFERTSLRRNTMLKRNKMELKDFGKLIKRAKNKK